MSPSPLSAKGAKEYWPLAAACGGSLWAPGRSFQTFKLGVSRHFPATVQILQQWVRGEDSHAECHTVTNIQTHGSCWGPNLQKMCYLRVKTHPFCLHGCSGRLPETSLIWWRQLFLTTSSAQSIPNLLPVPGQEGRCRRAPSPLLLTFNKELHICQNDASGVPSETFACYFGFGSPQSLHATIFLTTDTLIFFDTSTSLPHSSCSETWSASQASTAAPQKCLPSVLEEAELLYPCMGMSLHLGFMHPWETRASSGGQTGTTSCGS